MKLLKIALYRGFLTQVVAWGLYYLVEMEFLRWLINPGFAASKLAGDSFSVAGILAVNWFLFTILWVAILVAAQAFLPGWAEEPITVAAHDPHRGYHEE